MIDKKKFTDAVLLTEGYAILQLEKKNKNLSFRDTGVNVYLIIQIPCSCGLTTDYLFAIPTEILADSELTVEELVPHITRQS